MRRKMRPQRRESALDGTRANTKKRRIGIAARATTKGARRLNDIASPHETGNRRERELPQRRELRPNRERRCQDIETLHARGDGTVRRVQDKRVVYGDSPVTDDAHARSVAGKCPSLASSAAPRGEPIDKQQGGVRRERHLDVLAVARIGKARDRIRNHHERPVRRNTCDKRLRTPVWRCCTVDFGRGLRAEERCRAFVNIQREPRTVAIDETAAEARDEHPSAVAVVSWRQQFRRAARGDRFDHCLVPYAPKRKSARARLERGQNGAWPATFKVRGDQTRHRM
jgi:hypothetical protein